MKGIELPVNTLIIIVIAVLVLIAVIGFFLGVWSPSTSGLGDQSQINAACLKYNCGNGDVSVKVKLSTGEVKLTGYCDGLTPKDTDCERTCNC